MGLLRLQIYEAPTISAVGFDQEADFIDETAEKHRDLIRTGKVGVTDQRPSRTAKFRKKKRGLETGLFS